MKTTEKRAIVPKKFEELENIETMQSTTSIIFMFLAWGLMACSIFALVAFLITFTPSAIVFSLSLLFCSLLFFAIGNVLAYLRKTSVITFEIWKAMQEEKERK